ncbi:hypothetical protein RvY_09520-2 [Ramazzottius varieornatus]|uniref:Uncharacterized protein n=1 Tax=Ramazzottius varieornatus TaxID=947166 RepID=A0A1D1VHI2_RAMVA|nr:hypothetical protein RvY_09520-2 [Ramazzottius varieornatus]
MAISLPAVARLKLLSSPAEIPGYPEQDRGNSRVNLAQLEVLLRTSKVLGCQWTPGRSELKALLQSCVQIIMSFDENSLGEISSYRVDQSFSACAKKKIAIACALSQFITVVAFSSTELATCCAVSSDEGPGAPQVHCQRRIVSLNAGDYDAHLRLNSGSDLLLYCLTPRSTAIAKRWRPKATGRPEWMVFVYACSTSRSKPLQRLHKLRGSERQKVFDITFSVDGMNIFTLFIYQDYPESLTIQRHVVEKHALRLISSNVFALPGAIVSLTIQPKTGWVALGLDDFSLVQISTWSNEIAHRGKSNVMPQIVRWSTDGMVLCVANSEGSISALGSCEWINLCSSGTNHSAISPSAILLVFERGPLALLQFAASEQGRRGQLFPLVRYYIDLLRFQECVSCLEASRNYCNVEELIQASQLILISMVQRIARVDESICEYFDLTEKILHFLRQPDSRQAQTAADTSAIQSCYSLLMRRYFACLVRYSAFDRALAMAELSKDYEFHQTLLKNASRVLDEQLKLRIENTASQFMGDKSNSSTLTNTTAIMAQVSIRPSIVTIAHKEDDNLSWKDLGEI